MAQKEFLVHIDLNKQQLLNASLQVLAVAPSSPAVGQIYWSTAARGGLGSAMIWTGTAWLDLGEAYTHATYSDSSFPAAATTGATIISKIELEDGHVTGVTTRNISLSDLGAAAATHTHAFGQITSLPTKTILGNDTLTDGPAKALTVAELMSLMSIGYGTITHLNSFPDQEQRTWSAEDLNAWVNAKISSYITVVNLALGTTTATTQPITNSAGTGFTLPSATTTLAGLMSAADKVKLNGITAGANLYVHPTANPGAHPFAALLTNGLKVLSQMTVSTEGHVTAIQGRDLTAADIATVMIVAGTNTTSTNQTWSASTINAKLQAAISQAQTGALTYKGEYNATTNTPNLATDTTIKIGWTYVVTGSGTFAGQAVEAGDMIIAKVDNPGSTAGNWQIVNKNIPAVLAASETASGIIELATAIEAIAGIDAVRAITPATLKAVLNDKLGGWYATFGDGSSTTFAITHTLNSTNVLVQVRKVSSKKEVIVDWAPTAADTVTINVNIPPANAELEVLISEINKIN